MVVVIVIGVPKLLLVVDGGACVLSEEPELEANAAVEIELMIEALLTCTHPFGEHSMLDGQHPPPVSVEHSTRDAMHFGGSSLVTSHW